MSDKAKTALELFEKILPNLSDLEIDRLTAFGEGVAFSAGIKIERTKAS